MKELLTEDGNYEAIRKGCFFYFKKQKKEILMGVEQTQAQAYLNNLSIQGQTQTGQTQQLKIQVIDPNKKNSEEFLLIKHMMKSKSSLLSEGFLQEKLHSFMKQLMQRKKI